MKFYNLFEIIFFILIVDLFAVSIQFSKNVIIEIHNQILFLECTWSLFISDLPAIVYRCESEKTTVKNGESNVTYQGYKKQPKSIQIHKI